MITTGITINWTLIISINCTPMCRHRLPIPRMARDIGSPMTMTKVALGIAGAIFMIRTIRISLAT